MTTASNLHPPVTAQPCQYDCRTRAFWRDFAERLWARAPGLYRGAAEGLLTTATVFDAVKVAGEAYRFDPQSVRLNFYVGREVLRDCGPLLPTAADADPQAYNQRVRDALGGRDYTLLVSNIHLHESVIWSVVRPILDLLYEQVGHPVAWQGWVDTAVFLGQYARTPFGVHYGPMDVMTFPLVGTKRFRAWSPRYVLAHPDIKDQVEYDDHLSDSTLYEADGGDLIYWPASTWHIAEGGEAFSMAWSLGLWRNQPSQRSAQFVGEVVRRLLANTTSDTEISPSSEGLPPSGYVAAPPEAWSATGKHLCELIREGVLEDALTMGWLRAASAHGFKEVPPLAEACDLPADVSVRLEPSARVYWRTVQDHLAVGCAGHVNLFPASAPVNEVLDRLARRQTVAVPVGLQANEDIHTLLQFLQRARVLEVAA